MRSAPCHRSGQEKQDPKLRVAGARDFIDCEPPSASANVGRRDLFGNQGKDRSPCCNVDVAICVMTSGRSTTLWNMEKIIITGTSGSGTGFLLSVSMHVGAAVAVSCFLQRVGLAYPQPSYFSSGISLALATQRDAGGEGAATRRSVG